MISDTRKRQIDGDYVFIPFHETYRWIAGTLTLALMYPNPATEKTRLFIIVSLLVLTQPFTVMILIDIYMSWLQGDMFNIIRHSTIFGPYLGAFFKMFLMFYKRAQAKQLIDDLNKDYESFNTFPKHHQLIATEYIQTSVFYTERLWVPLITVFIMSFPGMAVLTTLYSQLFDEVPRRYMIHDMNFPFSEPEKRFESPYFEMQFVYMFAIGFVLLFNYTSFDGLYSIMTNHACLKMSLYCAQLEDAFLSQDPDLTYRLVVQVIHEQEKLYRFSALLQDMFNIWLGTILVSTMIQIGSLLFHLSGGYGFDLRYTLFSICAVVHIFLPCKNAANLKMMSANTADMVYCSGWERIESPRVRRLIPFLMMRAQLPIHTVVFKMFNCDMELFVNILRTSYSMFTLLRS